MKISVKPSKEREAREYLKRHPFDTLQPGDKLFNKVWGNKIKRDGQKMEKSKREAEKASNEDIERRNFRTKMHGGEWKKKYFI